MKKSGHGFPHHDVRNLSLIARFMGPTWGPSGADRTQVGPMLPPWTMVSGIGYEHHGEENQCELIFVLKLFIGCQTDIFMGIVYCPRWFHYTHIALYIMMAPGAPAQGLRIKLPSNHLRSNFKFISYQLHANPEYILDKVLSKTKCSPGIHLLHVCIVY